MPDLCPTMTSNTAPSGTVTSDMSNAWKALDDDEATYAYGTGSPGYWQYQFASGQVVEWYSILRSPGGYPDPVSWILKASNNGSTWTTLDTQASPTWSGDLFVKGFSNATSYTYYKLDSIYGSTSNFRIQEIQFWTGPHTDIVPESIPTDQSVGMPYVVLGAALPQGVEPRPMPTFRPEMLNVGVGPLSGSTPATPNPTLDITPLAEGLQWDSTTRGGMGGASFFMRQPTGSRSTKTSTNLCPDPLGTDSGWWNT